jgi:hypothetical protein
MAAGTTQRKGGKSGNVFESLFRSFRFSIFRLFILRLSGGVVFSVAVLLHCRSTGSAEREHSQPLHLAPHVNEV